MLDSVYLHAKSRDQISDALWPVLKNQVEEAIEHWREPDHGIWEVRGEPQHFTSSKVMCWVALDRGAKLAELEGETACAQQWRAIAEEIKADILANGVDSRGVFVQRYGSDALDASLLLVVLNRFLPPDDPRVRNTVLAIADELTQDGLVLRYRVEETDDGLSGEEGTFTICSFWLVSALVEIGEISAGQAPVRAAAVARQPAGSVRRGDRPAHRTAPGQLPAGVHPPGVDQRRGARDPRRGAVRQHRRVHAGQRPDVGRRSALNEQVATEIMSGATRGANRDEDFGAGCWPGGDHDGGRGGGWKRIGCGVNVAGGNNCGRTHGQRDTSTGRRRHRRNDVVGHLTERREGAHHPDVLRGQRGRHS